MRHFPTHTKKTLVGNGTLSKKKNEPVWKIAHFPTKKNVLENGTFPKKKKSCAKSFENS